MRRSCPICQKSLTATTFERHYQKELSQLQTPTLPSTNRLGKRHAAMTAKNRILGKSSSQDDSPEKLLQQIQRRMNQRQKMIDSINEDENGMNHCTCPICGDILEGDLIDINTHIDHCLENSESDQTNTNTFEEYTWAGQTRIRVTSLFEGDMSSLSSTSKRRLDEDTNEDLDIDQDDTLLYGPQQYTEEDIIHVKENTNESESSTTINEPSSNDELARAKLLIESLKERIRQQEQLIARASKCLICMEEYQKPTTSVMCWHVYCEVCWLRSLGVKKVCPQCQTITQPADLRRIYM
jgi:hypothetical protein